MSLSKAYLSTNKSKELFSKLTIPLYVEINRSVTVSGKPLKTYHWNKQCLELKESHFSFEIKVSALDLEKRVICLKCKEPDDISIIVIKRMLAVWQQNTLTLFSDQKLVDKYFCHAAAWKAFYQLSTKEAWLRHLLSNNNIYCKEGLKTAKAQELLEKLTAFCAHKATELNETLASTTFQEKLVENIAAEIFSKKVLANFIHKMHEQLLPVSIEPASTVILDTMWFLKKLLYSKTSYNKAISKTASFLARGLYNTLAETYLDENSENKLSSETILELINEMVLLWKVSFPEDSFEEFLKPTNEYILFSSRDDLFYNQGQDFYFASTLNNAKIATLLEVYCFSHKEKAQLKAMLLPKNAFIFTAQGCVEEYSTPLISKSTLELCSGLWTPENPNDPFASLKDALIAAYTIQEK